METFIELKVFGDFNVMNTVCIMVSSEKHDVEEIYKEFYKTVGIESNKGLSYEMLSKINVIFIKFLKSKGFKELKTNQIYFCD